MKKILLLLFLFVFIEKTNAYYFYYDEEKVEDMFITRSDGIVTMSGNPYLLKRKSDNKYVYCIEPLNQLNQSTEYIEYNKNSNIFNISNDTLKRINLISYYGYNYLNHTDIKWYGITQYLIWKEVEPNLDIYFTDSRFGNRIIKYEKEMEELNSLVDNDIKGLNLNESYDITTGTEYILISNPLLENYDVINNSNLNVEIKDNQLIVKALKKGEYEFSLKRKNKFNNQFLLYYNANGQNLFLNGDISEEINIKVNVNVASLNLIKKDTNETLNKDITLKNAWYGLYDSKDTLLIKKATDENGKILFEDLKLGKYKIKEIEPSYGYKLDIQEYSIDLKEDTSIVVNEERELKKLIIHKVYQEDDYIDEENASFEIYKDDDLITTITTSKDGLGKAYLEYGNYKIVQTDGKIGYCYSEDIFININSEYQEEEILIINERKKEERPIYEVLGVKNTNLNYNYNVLIILIFCIIGKYVIKN